MSRTLTALGALQSTADVKLGLGACILKTCYQAACVHGINDDTAARCRAGNSSQLINRVRASLAEKETTRDKKY